MLPFSLGVIKEDETSVHAPFSFDISFNPSDLMYEIDSVVDEDIESYFRKAKTSTSLFDGHPDEWPNVEWEIDFAKSSINSSELVLRITGTAEFEKPETEIWRPNLRRAKCFYCSNVATMVGKDSVVCDDHKDLLLPI